MKKLITIAFVAVLTMFGLAAPASATLPTPEDCVESDNPTPGIDCSLVDEDGVYPVPTITSPITSPATVAPTTAPPPTPAPTVPPAGLPATGSSGVNGVMQIGGLLLVGGLVVFVAARRRSPATTS